MKIAFIRPRGFGGIKRGVDYYSERLYSAIKLSGVDIVWENFDLWSEYEKYDLVHVPYFEPYTFGIPIKPKGKLVVTIHDATRFVFKEQFPAGPRGKLEWLGQKFFFKKIDHVLTDSKQSKNDISKEYGIPSEKITVTYLAADKAFQPVKDGRKLNQTRIKYNLPEKFVLYVGGGNWNKNVISLCKATDSLSLPLVLVNKIWTETEIDPNVENHPLEQVLHFIKGKSNFHTLGFVETEELVNIYNLATVYVQPSIYEGFGLPVLEAMSSGTPVICAKNSSLAEIGGRAPEYINDPNSDEIASAIKKVFGWSKLEREKKVKIGLSESKHFSWELTGKATIGIYKKLLNS